jgi:hypothetical protein
MNWFVTQVDRDHVTGMYGNGVRLYDKENYSYKIITGVSYDNKENSLTVKDQYDNTIVLNNEPNNTLFYETVYAQWYCWDILNTDDPDRLDYEPFAFNSLEALARSMNMCNNTEKIKVFYKKQYFI